MISLQEAERVIGEPATTWKARCFEIASKLVEAGAVKGTAVYGHWLGPVNRKSVFAGKDVVGFIQHGWIVTDDKIGSVVDPTRWVFEAAPPYIFEGKPADPEMLPGRNANPLLPLPCLNCDLMEDEHDNDHPDDCGCYEAPEWYYDEGGNMHRMRTRPMPPARATGGDERYQLSLPAGAVEVVRSLLELPRRSSISRLTLDQIRWIANAPYHHLDEHAHAIYQAIIRLDFSALIPIDNRKRAERLHGAFKGDL